jgi:hypothetical protein
VAGGTGHETMSNKKLSIERERGRSAAPRQESPIGAPQPRAFVTASPK